MSSGLDALDELEKLPQLQYFAAAGETANYTNSKMTQNYVAGWLMIGQFKAQNHGSISLGKLGDNRSDLKHRMLVLF